MSSYSGNTETGALLQRHAVGELEHLFQWNHGVLGSGSKGTVTLSAITPYAPTDPFPRHTFAHCVNSARTIAVRNHTRIWHSNAKRILTLLHISRIDA